MKKKEYNLQAFETYFNEWDSPEDVVQSLTDIAERMSIWCTYTDGQGGEYIELRESLMFIQRLREVYKSANKE